MADENQPKEVTVEEALNHVKQWISDGELDKAEKGLTEITEFAPESQEAKALLEDLKQKKGEVFAAPTAELAVEPAAEPESFVVPAAETNIFTVAEPVQAPVAEPIAEPNPFPEIQPIAEPAPINTMNFDQPVAIPEPILASEPVQQEPVQEQIAEPTSEPIPEPSMQMPETELPGLEKIEHEDLMGGHLDESPKPKKKIFMIAGLAISIVILAGGGYFAYSNYFAGTEDQGEEEIVTEDVVAPEEQEPAALSEEDVAKMLFPDNGTPAVEEPKETDVVDEMQDFVEIFEDTGVTEEEPSVVIEEEPVVEEEPVATEEPVVKTEPAGKVKVKPIQK